MEYTKFQNIPYLRNFYIKQKSETEFLKKKNGTNNFQLKSARTYNFELGIGNLDLAIQIAKDLEQPSRSALYEIYTNLNDLHLKSQMRTASFKVTSQPWMLVDKNLKPNKDMMELFQKKWFKDLNNNIIGTEFWGHSLIYFNMDLETKEFTSCKLFPRNHVLPERKSIIPDLGNPDKMFNYVEIAELNSLFIEVEDSEPLGLLEELARYSIYKNYAVKDWGRSSEKWGDPHIVLKSASDDDAENEKKEEYLKNFGNNNYAMLSEDDVLELLERKTGGNSHNIFKDLIKFNNDENSHGVNGQTATSDEKSYVGAAEVHERILEAYTIDRLTDLMYFHNEITIPFLINYNGGDNAYQGLKGLKWIPTALMEDEKKKDDKNKGNGGKKPKDGKLNQDGKLDNNLENPFI